MGGLVLSHPTAAPTAGIVGGDVGALLPADILRTPAALGVATITQNVRPLSTTVWAGNRLQRVHRYLAAPSAFGAGVEGRTLSVLLGHQGRAGAAAGVTCPDTLTPVAFTNLSHQSGAAYPTQVTGWAAASLHTSSPMSLSRSSQAPRTGAAPIAQSRVHGLGAAIGGVCAQPRLV